MDIHELPPSEFCKYQNAKGQEEELRAKAANLLRLACIQEQIAEGVVREFSRCTGLDDPLIG
jgi:hypothetical protein